MGEGRVRVKSQRYPSLLSLPQGERRWILAYARMTDLFYLFYNITQFYWLKSSNVDTHINSFILEIYKRTFIMNMSMYKPTFPIASITWVMN